MQQNALGEMKSVCFCSTLGHLLRVKFEHLLHLKFEEKNYYFCISPGALMLFWTLKEAVLNTSMFRTTAGVIQKIQKNNNLSPRLS